MTPLLSVVIPTYNAAKFLRPTLTSVLQQSLREIEVILADDGSTDETRLLVEAMHEPRLRLLPLEHSGGPARPRNAGIRAAAGRYIALFDSDDIMLPGKLQMAVKILEDLPEVSFICSEFEQIDEAGQVIRKSSLQEYRMFRRALVPTSWPGVHLVRPDRLYAELLRANFIATSSVVFRREVVDEVGGFDEALTNADDADFWLRLARAGKRLAFVEEAGHQYRRRRGSISAGGTRRFPSVLQVLEKQYQYPLTGEEKRLVDKRLMSNRASYAWWLKKDGAYREAFRLYRQSLRHGVSPPAVKGLLHSGTCLLLQRVAGGHKG